MSDKRPHGGDDSDEAGPKSKREVPGAAGPIAEDGTQFVALSYNILSRSLGSNCVPWVMVMSDEALVRRVERATGSTWQAWKEAEVYGEYRRHFHKNLATGDYTTMRRLWSARRLASQADVPSTLRGVSFHALDQVTYTGDEGGQVTASTMRGLLRAKLPQEGLGLQLFEHLMELEEEVFAWETRGPRIFREIVSPRTLRLVPVGTAMMTPDIVLLQEYDVHSIRADYRGGGEEETFPAAMEAEGYAGILFKDPLKGRTPPSGLGIFWRRSAFRLVDDTGDVAQGLGPGELECGSSLGDRVRNTDFMEQWHRLRAGGSNERELMPAADRRHCASVLLEHVQSGRKLRVISAHLMTTSRDGPRTNEYPGEVRAGELGSLREEIRRCAGSGDALLVAGDFNTEARDMGVFTGRLRSTLTGSPLEVCTGLEELDASSPSGPGRALRWRADEPGEPSLRLREAFEPVHRWGKGVGPHAEGGHCTSMNAERLEWIDYVWYHEASLRPVALSDCAAPARPLPDREHGSDHLPVAVHFEMQ